MQGCTPTFQAIGGLGRREGRGRAAGATQGRAAASASQLTATDRAALLMNPHEVLGRVLLVQCFLSSLHRFR